MASSRLLHQLLNRGPTRAKEVVAMPSPGRPPPGGAAQASGKHGEDIVSIFHQMAENSRVASFWKIPTPTCHRNKQLTYAARSIVDYLGVTLDGTATFIAEETKRSVQARFPLALVPDHQRAYLAEQHSRGAIAVVTIVDKADRVHTVPWPAFAAFTGASVSWDDLLPYQVTIDRYFLRFLRK